MKCLRTANGAQPEAQQQEDRNSVLLCLVLVCFTALLLVGWLAGLIGRAWRFCRSLGSGRELVLDAAAFAALGATLWLLAVLLFSL